MLSSGREEKSEDPRVQGKAGVVNVGVCREVLVLTVVVGVPEGKSRGLQIQGKVEQMTVIVSPGGIFKKVSETQWSGEEWREVGENQRRMNGRFGVSDCGCECQ